MPPTRRCADCEQPLWIQPDGSVKMTWRADDDMIWHEAHTDAGHVLLAGPRAVVLDAAERIALQEPHWSEDVVTVNVDVGVHGSAVIGDDEDVYEHRNELAKALRRIVTLLRQSAPEFTVKAHLIALNTLEKVFPGDPMATEGLYDTPTADGVNVLEDALRAERDR